MRFFPPSPPPIVYCLTLMALMEEDGNLAWLYFLNVSLSVHSHTPATTHTLGSHRRVSGAGAFSFLSGSCLFLHLMLGCSSLCLVLCEFQTLASGRQVCAGPAGHFSIWPSLWPCLSISWGGPELQLAGYAAADTMYQQLHGLAKESQSQERLMGRKHQTSWDRSKMKTTSFKWNLETK